MSRSKDMALLLDDVEREGWTKIQTKAGWKFRSPDGVTTVGVHRSPTSDGYRALRNKLAEFRRGGYTGGHRA